MNKAKAKDKKNVVHRVYFFLVFLEKNKKKIVKKYIGTPALKGQASMVGQGVTSGRNVRRRHEQNATLCQYACMNVTCMMHSSRTNIHRIRTRSHTRAGKDHLRCR
jgi:hypothetical protein